MRDDDWRNWKNGRYDNRYRGVRRHSGQRNRKKIIAIVGIMAILFVGYFVYQNYFTNGIIQKEANTAVNNAIKMQPALGGIIKPTFDTVSKITKEVGQQVTNITSLANPQAPGSTSAPVEQTTSEINSQWVSTFMSVVNAQRQQSGLRPLVESQALDNTAKTRFDTMITHYQISHYGATGLNIGEVVFYPDGYSPQDYAINLQNTAPLHWQLLLDPQLGVYGYHVETGPTVEILGSCSVSEIPGPDIDEVQFFQQHGCQTTSGNATWLVIDLNFG